MLRLSRSNLNGDSLSVLFEWNLELFGPAILKLMIVIAAAMGLKAYGHRPTSANDYPMEPSLRKIAGASVFHPQSSIVAATSSASSTAFLSAALRFEGLVSMVTFTILPVNLFSPGL